MPIAFAEIEDLFHTDSERLLFDSCSDYEVVVRVLSAATLMGGSHYRCVIRNVGQRANTVSITIQCIDSNTESMNIHVWLGYVLYLYIVILETRSSLQNV